MYVRMRVSPSRYLLAYYVCCCCFIFVVESAAYVPFHHLSKCLLLLVLPSLPFRLVAARSPSFALFLGVAFYIAPSRLIYFIVFFFNFLVYYSFFFSHFVLPRLSCSLCVVESFIVVSFVPLFLCVTSFIVSSFHIILFFSFIPPVAFCDILFSAFIFIIYLNYTKCFSWVAAKSHLAYLQLITAVCDCDFYFIRLLFSTNVVKTLASVLEKVSNLSGGNEKAS